LSSDVVVVGGGTVGLAVAWRAAREGLSAIVVDDDPGRGASWAAAGMLAPVTEVHPGEDALLALNLAASERYPAFVEELEDAAGVEVGYRRSGTLVVARDADEKAALDELFSLQQDLGLRTERLTGAECRDLEPGLTPRTRAGILVSGDHQVDNRALVGALLEACRRAGVDLRAGRVAAIGSSERVETVTLEDGTGLAAAAAVVCAGCWSGAISGVPPDAVPVRPVKGQLVHLRVPADAPVAGRSIRGGGVHAVYVVPRADGRIVVGATVEERGYDTRVTVDAVLTLLREAFEMLPGIAEADLIETTAGLRPGSPDNAPLIGATGVEGLYVATGHYRNGILLAPVTADAVVELLTTGRLPGLVAPFVPTRFAEPAIP
jgi:glycine oxidase